MANIKKYGLVGYPLGHSFSQSFFVDLFARLGVSGEYENFALSDSAQLEGLVGSGTMDGLSVTIPYKREVLGMVDRLDPAARAVGAVNCIDFRDGVSTGYNTDIVGFKQSLVEFLDGHAVGRALILGTGGAALAVRYALDELGIEHRTVSRERGKGDYTYGELDGAIVKAHKLIINTTPLGMWPNVDSSPEIPFEELSQNHYLYDLVYNPEVTEFIRRADGQGAHTMSGLRMLHLQALAAWEIWSK